MFSNRLANSGVTSGAPLGLDEEAIRRAATVVSRDDLRLSIARPDEYAEIEALSRTAPAQEMTTPLTAALITWMVDSNPCGRGFVVIARDAESGALLGHFVFYRWTLVHRAPDGNPSPLPAFLYVRLYVKPEARRRGVFSAMTRFGLDLVRQIGVGLAYTAPNPRSAAGFAKFGISRRGPLPFWLRPIVPGWRLLSGGARQRGVELERRSAFDDAFDDAFDEPLATELPPTARYWSAHNAAQLNWRYRDRPDVAYEIRYLRTGGRLAGYLVTRRMTIGGRDVLAISDGWASPAAPHVLGVGLDDALAAGPPVRVAIAIGAASVHSLRSAFLRAGLVPFPTRLLPQPLMIYGGAVDGSPSPSDLPQLDEWHVTPADWDVF